MRGFGKHDSEFIFLKSNIPARGPILLSGGNSVLSRIMMEMTMTVIQKISERPNALRFLATGVAAASLLVWSGMAQAAPVPESFSGLARKVTPAVVNIASAHKPDSAQATNPALPFDLPPGSPFEKFFKQFQDRMGEGDGRGGNARPNLSVGLGSGFIIDPDGYVVTNNHVVDEASEVKVRLDDDTVFTARIIGTDPQTDLALLKIETEKPLPFVSFGDSARADVGDWVMAVGNPFGLGGTVTAGIVSARGRNIESGPYDDFLQVDASINKGNSGGPLFNMDGNVIGVNTAIYSPNGGSVGIGFAIPSNIVKTVIAQIRENGRVERGWLGVQIQQTTPEIAQAVGLDTARGAMVTQVVADSPAEKAGLKQGDVVLNFAGKPVDGPRKLALIVSGEAAGRETGVTIWRDNREVTLKVVPGLQPNQAQMASAPAAENGSHHSTALKAELAALTPQRRAEFRVSEDETGVLVLDVKDESIFEQGLRAGDVIKKVGDVAVSSPGDVDKLVRKTTTGSEKTAVLLLISRQGHDLFLALKPGVA